MWGLMSSVDTISPVPLYWCCNLDCSRGYIIFCPFLRWALTTLPNRPHTCPASQPQPFGEKQPPSGLKGCADSCDILDIVFQRMKMRLEQRRVSLSDRIKAVIHRTDGMLSKADVQKVSDEQKRLHCTLVCTKRIHSKLITGMETCLD